MFQRFEHANRIDAPQRCNHALVQLLVRTVVVVAVRKHVELVALGVPTRSRRVASSGLAQLCVLWRIVGAGLFGVALSQHRFDVVFDFRNNIGFCRLTTLPKKNNKVQHKLCASVANMKRNILEQQHLSYVLTHVWRRTNHNVTNVTIASTTKTAIQ